MEEKKTHRLIAKPQMSVRFLADYMAASDQARRTILRSCKYRAIARMVQHDDAQLTIAKYLLSGSNDPHALEAESEYIRHKLADDDFESDCNQINADYVKRFASVVENFALPKGAEFKPGKTYTPLAVNGVSVTFKPNLLIQRITKQNTVKTGSLMLRYKKGARLSPEVGAYQSAAMHGVLCLHGSDEGAEVDRPLCLTLDAHSGEAYSAPTNAVSRFNNMKAACATIAEAWDNLQPPKGAVL